MRDEFGLMIAAYILDPRFKADYITQSGIDAAFRVIIDVSLKSGISFSDIQRFISPEFTNYLLQRNKYAFKEEKPAIEWWCERADSGRFQTIGLRFANLRSSSANIERTFSCIKYIQGRSRHNLSRHTLIDLTRVKINRSDLDLEMVDEAMIDEIEIWDHSCLDETHPFAEASISSDCRHRGGNDACGESHSGEMTAATDCCCFKGAFDCLREKLPESLRSNFDLFHRLQQNQ